MDKWLLGEGVMVDSRLPKILDTTLREGELFQRLRLETKVKVARLLAEAGLDRIELTVDYPPRTSRRDVEEVVEALRSYDVEIVIHGRACRRDVEAAAKYDVDGIGVYMAPTRLHREYKFGGMGFREAVDRLRDAIAMAKDYGFRYRRATVEDASRFYFEEDGFGKLLQIIGELKDEGATIISVPDTSGILTPPQVRKFFGRLKESCEIPLSAHFHNDYGAALIGVEELQTSILGIGDRNGIADLYEVAAPLIDIHGFRFRLRRDFLRELYQRFSKLTGIKIPFRHPLSDEARTIRAGVHQSMAIKAPHGYIPEGKLRHDFAKIFFEVTPFLSKRVVERILGAEIDSRALRAISEKLAEKASEHGGSLDPRHVKEVLEGFGFKVDEKILGNLLKPERAYILLNLDPKYDVGRMIDEVIGWEDVEEVNEVYGDADLVIVAKIDRTKQNVVERIRKEFGKAITGMRVLITD
ncbi:MAG: hypothetical protein B6U65_04870 [Candidatus Wolframiiraptor sp. EX4484-121]|nr:MAG: hypothetical protein B6U65_04870 [Candidatus Wolframiiraptor sp. EX4484-121]